MSKKIGIPGWVVERKFFGVGIAYAEYLRSFGQLIILNPDDQVRDDLDLLVLPGGLDVSPSRQQVESLSLYTGESNPMLEFFDTHALPGYLSNNTPILGICRGAQSLWTNFGGELIQHNFQHKQSLHPKDECHGLFWSTFYDDRKATTLVKNVNSRHHQTMNTMNHSPESIQPIAWAVEGGAADMSIVEIFRHENDRIWGVQYHPEDCPNDRFTPYIIHKLLSMS